MQSYSTTTITIFCISLYISFCLQCNIYIAARDTITATTPLTSDDILSSAANRFQLGFFKPNNYNRKYLGIWYAMDNETVKTIVWVANRHQPLSEDFSKNITGVFTIAEDGNLKVWDTTGACSYFSSNVSSSGSAIYISRTAKLLDSGNLVLLDDQTGKTLWQSFDNPTDTFLPGMEMDNIMKLNSWLTTENDPELGKFWFQEDKDVDDGYVILKSVQEDLEANKGRDVVGKKTRIYWKSGGSASNFTPSKMYESAALLLSNFKQPKEVNVTIRNANYSRLVIHSSGEIQFLSWDAYTKQWNTEWSEPEGPCSIYNFCGDFASCNASLTNSSSCNCLDGFEPTSPDYWKSRDFYLSGCKRKSNKCSKNDTFLKLNAIKVGSPNIPSFKAATEQDCRVKCLDNCQCQAYLYINGSLRDNRDTKSGCWVWTVNVTDIQETNTSYAYSLFIRVAAGEGYQQRKKKSLALVLVLISAAVISGIVLVCCFIYMSRQRMSIRREVSIQDNSVLAPYSLRRVEDMGEDDKEGIDVPFVDMGSILAATDNFSDANKLGQGGFGPVYMGRFSGELIAVKRLSNHSGQGLEEFMNEVMLIAKLQHRNLVKLLGYCSEGNEKILLYEHMPNKSLDAFIFDRTLCNLLDWNKRFEIIMGVARGLLYLHQDSRLRIIHRDMKVSNILLDEDMNPKISDFGLARIVGGRDTEITTTVVGTFGYMSPEYALEGQFSIKSDVFSFGVVVLEIISGKKNSGFYKSQLAWNLLSYAWSFWEEERALALLDSSLEESCNGSEVVKCINIGLLCVQEDPDDRPTMSQLLFMLGSEAETLPNPKKPAFISRKLPINSTTSSSSKPSLECQHQSSFSS